MFVSAIARLDVRGPESGITVLKRALLRAVDS